MKRDIESKQLNTNPHYDKDKFNRYVSLAYREGSNTSKQYNWAFRKFGPVLTTEQQLDYFVVTYLRGAKKNPFYSGFLKAFMECFEIEYKFPKDLSKAKNYEGEKRHKFLSYKDVQRIIQGTTPYVSLMCRIYFDTGLRLRELMNVKIDDIYIDDRAIEGIGKNGKPFREKMSQHTMDLLSNYLASAPDSEFPFQVRSCSDHAKSFWYFLKKECKQLGIDNVTPHRLRHSLGRHLLLNGFGLEKIATKLRHSRVDTTRIYASSTKEEVDKQIDDQVFGDIMEEKEE